MKLLLISFWLLLSFPFNLATLKHMVRGCYWLIAHMHAGLDANILIQYLLAAIFVIVVIRLLLSRIRIGRILAIVLLVGSCCAMVGNLLLDTLAWGAFPTHWYLMGLIVAFNITCLVAMREST